MFDLMFKLQISIPDEKFSMRDPKTNVSLGQMSYNLPEDMDRLR